MEIADKIAESRKPD